jgi:hypothetical protein
MKWPFAGNPLKPLIHLILGMAGLLVVCTSLYSQGSSARIVGTVTDKSGGAIAGATVTVTDVQRNVTRNLTTDDAGDYNAPNLIPGTYTVRGASAGFNSVERQNITLEIGQDARVDLQLQPGAVTQTITVTEALPMLETTNAVMGGTLQSKIIESMPLNGRNFTNLLQLQWTAPPRQHLPRERDQRHRSVVWHQHDEYGAECGRCGHDFVGGCDR